MVSSEEQILVQIGRIYSGTPGVVGRDVMAYTDWRGRWWCSYRRGTIVVCSANLLLVICVLHAAVSPLQMKSPPDNLVMLSTGNKPTIPAWNPHISRVHCLGVLNGVVLSPVFFSGLGGIWGWRY